MEQHVRNAIACITVRQNGVVLSRGTGFLVAPGVVLTALHVVKPEGEVVLAFPDHETQASVGRADEDLDWAELLCADPPPARPLPLGEARSGAAWLAYGWPDAQYVDGMAVHGTVTNHDARIKGHPALQLYCREAAAGAGMKLPGLSGGPVFVGDRVVGLARFALRSGDRSEAGTLYATAVAGPAAQLGLRVTSPRSDDANLDVLRERVQHFWIEGVLERSLRSEAVSVQMRQEEGAVESPWEAVLERPAGESRVLPYGTTAIEVFDEVQGSLLILGTPGSGKTTTLLTLARDLLARGATPLVLHLSTWTQGGLREWVLAELRSKYQIPEDVGRPWLDGHRLALLLDGLDEVAQERRAACVEAINGYANVAGLAVTCRAGDYEKLPAKLRTNGAVCLQPLTEDQIGAYVASAGPSLAGLGRALEQDEGLRDLAKSPLMLNVMAQAYADVPVETLLREHSVDHLFDTFIERMYRRPGQAYDRRLTEDGLRRIARGMLKRGRSVFLIEELQPDAANPVAYRLAFVVVVGILTGACCATILMQPNLNKPVPDWPWIRPVEALVWVLVGPLWVLGVTLVERPRALLRNFAVYWLLWLPIVVAMLPMMELRKQHFFICIGVSLLVALRGWSHSFADEIRPVEALGFSWQRACRWAAWGALIGVAHAVVGVLRLEQDPTPAFAFIPGMAAVGALLGGPQPRVVRGKTRPNEGMRLTWRTACRMALLAVIPVAFAPLGLALSDYVGYGVQFTLVLLVATTVMMGLWFGALDLIKHYLVRLLVPLPFDLPRFLDHACRLNFMQHVGSGYIFTHRLLCDHFAERQAAASGEPDQPGDAPPGA